MTRTIHVNEDIRLERGLQTYIISTHRDLELTFTGDVDAQVFIRIQEAGKLRIRTYAAAEAHITYLFWNEMSGPLDVDESHEVMQNAAVHVGYGELNGGNTNRTTYMALREPGAQGIVSGAAMVTSNKRFVVQVANMAPHTSGKIENYAVVLGGGKLFIDAVGKIVNGASGSQSHQTSRALSFADGQQTKILPELLIDENDVQASHAMSIGHADPEQLYYMQSRGLSRAQCVGLLASGYLMPIADTIADDTLAKLLHEEMERTVSTLCSM